MKVQGTLIFHDPQETHVNKVHKKSFRKHGLFLANEPAEVWDPEVSTTPSSEGKDKQDDFGRFTQLLWGKQRGPDTWAQPWLLAGLCSPPAGHTTPHRTPVSDKVAPRPQHSERQNRPLAPHETADILPLGSNEGSPRLHPSPSSWCCSPAPQVKERDPQAEGLPPFQVHLRGYPQSQASPNPPQRALTPSCPMVPVGGSAGRSKRACPGAWQAGCWRSWLEGAVTLGNIQFSERVPVASLGEDGGCILPRYSL